MSKRPGIFLDRDGVVIEEVNYLSEPGQVRLVPGVGPAIARLNRAGLPVIIVTNQAGVARGLFPEESVPAVHAHLASLLAPFSARIDAFYYCPHHPTAGVGPYRVECDCRKPRPGMLLRAAREWDIDLGRSWMVGDKLCDVQAGAAAGCRCVLVHTGYGAGVADADLRALAGHLMGRRPDLPAAVELCLAPGMAGVVGGVPLPAGGREQHR